METKLCSSFEPNFSSFVSVGVLLSTLKIIFRLHDVFHGQIDKGEMCLSVVYEKCDWDLYEFLRTIPRDMGDPQCRHIAKQVKFLPLCHFLKSCYRLYS